MGIHRKQKQKIIFVSAFAWKKEKEIQMNRCYWDWTSVKTRKMHNDATMHRIRCENPEQSHIFIIAAAAADAVSRVQ